VILAAQYMHLALLPAPMDVAGV